jgi:hypothetical protein
VVGGSLTAHSFSILVTGSSSPSPSTFNGAEAGVTVTLNQGNYIVTENPVALTDGTYYVASFSAGCSEAITVGQTKTCTITNVFTIPVTRSQGFWATHTSFTNYVFTHNVIGNSMTIGTTAHNVIITDITTTHNSILFGAFWANVSKTYAPVTKRSSTDQARMILLQQLVAAKLNCAAFGCSSAIKDVLILNADKAYATGTKSDMTSLASKLDAYNNIGNNKAIPSSFGSAPGSATPQTSQTLANMVFWNSP